MYLMVNVIAKKALVEDNVTNVKLIIGEILEFWMDVPLAVVILKAQNLFNVILKLENVSAGKVSCLRVNFFTTVIYRSITCFSYVLMILLDH